MATGSTEMNVEVKGCNGTNEPTSTAIEIPKSLPVDFFKEPILLRRQTFYEPEPYKVGTSLAYSYFEPPSKKPRIEGKGCSFDSINCLAQALNLEETKPNLYEKK
jgi:hypothetical protein